MGTYYQPLPNNSIFRQVFKKYSTNYRNENVDLSEIVDLSKLNSVDQNEDIFIGNFIDSKFEFGDEKYNAIFNNVCDWKIYGFKNHPGLFVVRNSMNAISQYYFTMRALSHYCQSPFWNNYSNHNYNVHVDQEEISLNGNIWDVGKMSHENCNHNAGLFDLHSKYLKWSQLGFLFHHDTHSYDREPYVALCPELKFLARYISYVLNIPNCVTFEPDSVLINHYNGSGGTLPKRKPTILRPHTDVYEQTMDYPIVTLSTGLPAIFLIGGNDPNDSLPPTGIWLNSGDICVLSGPSRTAYHAVPRIAADSSLVPKFDCLDYHRIPSYFSNDDKDIFFKYSKDIGLYMQQFRINFSVRQFLSPL